MRRIGLQLIAEKKASILASTGKDGKGVEKKDVQGRDLLTLLIAACYDEVTEACRAALRACAPGDAEGRLRRSTLAFRTWSLAHPPEFGLLYGTPVAGGAAHTSIGRAYGRSGGVEADAERVTRRLDARSPISVPLTTGPSSRNRG